MHVTVVVVPTANKFPEATIDPPDVVHELDDIPELSTALKFQVTATAGVFALEGVAMIGTLELYGGHVSVGGVISTFFTEKEHDEFNPLLSEAEQLILAILNAVKLIGLVLLQAILTIENPVDAVAVGDEKVDIAAKEMPLVGEIIMFAGQIMTGVAEAETANINEPPEITELDDKTRIVYDDVACVGVVENVNVYPPSLETNPVGEAGDVTVKSEARPVVAPPAPFTVIVQPIVTPAFATAVPKQIKVDAVVGTPYTIVENIPFVIVDPPTWAVIVRAVERRRDTELGFTEKVKVAPPLEVVAAVRIPLLAEMVKSVTRPTVGAENALHEIMQVIGFPTRSGLALVQLRVDAAVGTVMRHDAPR